MHDDLSSFSQSQSQSFSKILKVRSENMKCMVEWVKKIIPDEKRRSWGQKSLGNKVLSEKNVSGRWKDTKLSREIERSESKIARTLHIEHLKSQQIERYQKVSRFKLWQIHLSRSYLEVSTAKINSMDLGAIEHLSRRQKLSRWIEELLRGYQDCDKKKLKSLIDSLAIERYRGAVEIA